MSCKLSTYQLSNKKSSRDLLKWAKGTLIKKDEQMVLFFIYFNMALSKEEDENCFFSYKKLTINLFE